MSEEYEDALRRLDNELHGDNYELYVYLYNVISGADDTVESLQNQVAALKASQVYLYNQGYGAGHNDTVEACYTDIHRDDVDTWHAEVVAELLADLNPPEEKT